MARSPSAVKRRTSSPFTNPCCVMPAVDPSPAMDLCVVTVCCVVQAPITSGSSATARRADDRVGRILLARLALLGLQRLVDLRLHPVDGAVLDHLAVDEQAWRTADVALLAERELVVDLLLHLGRVAIGVPLLHVETDLLGDALDGVGREIAAGLVELVVHLPELALALGRNGGLGRG